MHPHASTKQPRCLENTGVFCFFEPLRPHAFGESCAVVHFMAQIPGSHVVAAQDREFCDPLSGVEEVVG